MTHDAFAERRVLAIVLAHPERLQETGLKPEDFYFDFSREIFSAIGKHGTGEVVSLGLPDDVSAYALDLDESYAPENLQAWARIVKAAAEHRAFEKRVSRLRGR